MSLQLLTKLLYIMDYPSSLQKKLWHERSIIDVLLKKIKIVHLYIEMKLKT